uniref:Uncharacterized protein n=1 Tax=Amphimedon queenslandica TaxID=400682 RepID=A0A1X7SE01_AMPQE
MSRFQCDISHVPGKLLYTADTLSRAPVTQVLKEREAVEMESFVQAIISSLPANDAKLQEYRQGQVEDEICSQIIQWCQSEWPDRGSVSSDLQPYRTKQNRNAKEFTEDDTAENSSRSSRHKQML